MKKKKKMSSAELAQHTGGERLKRSIINTRNVIRKKFRELHNKKLAVNEQISETYKPIIEPLENLVKHEKVKQEHLQNNQVLSTPKVEKKETQQKGYMFMPDTLFKTAVAPHRDNPFQLTTQPSSSSQTHNVSGVHSLDYDDDDFENNIRKQIRQSNSLGAYVSHESVKTHESA